MPQIMGLVALAFGLGALVCFIMVVVQMFKHGKTAPGIVSIIGFFCGLGYLFAFIYGWTKAGEWRIKNLMTAWTVLFIVYIGLIVTTIPATLQQMQEIQQQQKPGQPAPEILVPIPAPVPLPAPEVPTPAPVPAP